MKIVIVASEFPPGPGGIGTHAYELARHLNEFGHQVSVLCRQDFISTDEYQTFNDSQPFEVIHLSSEGNYILKSIQQLGVLMQHISKTKPDMVIASGLRMAWITAIASLMQSFKWIAIGHGTEFGVSGWQYHLTRWAFQRTDGTVCVSNYTKNYMLNRNIKPDNIAVIPNGADNTSFSRIDESVQQAYRESLGLSNDINVLVTVGNVTPRKGQEIVIRAMPHIIATHPNTVYLMAGLPTTQDELQTIASDLGVADNIRFLGRIPREDLIKLLNSADIFIMTSRHTETGDFEGYGIAVIEAALCGRPAVVAGGSGLSEAIVDGETGIEVPMNDPEATADAVRRLLDDENLLHTMGKTAEQQAREQQTWERRIRSYESYLSKIMEAG